jgi:glycosyltransferase involved in cell wall biosynthesis
VKVLFVQHATDIGGSALSLKMLIQDGVQAGWISFLVVRNEAIRAYYKDTLPDTQMFLMPRLPTFDHHSAHVFGATPREVARVLYRIALLLTVAPALRRLIRQVQPDTIHLNSSVLIPLLPLLAGRAKRLGVHIRERVASGWRNSLFRHLLEKHADYCVFISPVEQQLLPAKPPQTAVIYNYIKPPAALPLTPQACVRSGQRKLTLLSLGGTSRIKGIAELLALAEAFPNDIQIRIVGSVHESLDRPVPPNIEIAPPTPDPLEEISRCDFLVFWTHQPHFPRPVYEAWLMKKPCIVSHCMRSQDDVDESSVLLAKGDEAAYLIAVVRSLITDKPSLDKLQEHAFRIAQEKFGPANFLKLKRVIEGHGSQEGSPS